MIFSIRPNSFKKQALRVLKVLAVICFWVLIWDLVARFVSRNNELMLLLLPRPITVFEKWLEIGFTDYYLTAVGHTLARIFAGFIIGIILGSFLGMCTHFSKICDMFLSPMMKTVRAVPVVAISILFFSLFESDSLPVSVVVLMVIPLIWQTVHDGLKLENRELSEMASVFKLSPGKRFLYIKLPRLIPPFLTTTVNALGLAWKSGVAAEVICEPNVGLGTILIKGKGMIDFSEVYAVTLTVVILSLVIEILFKFLCQRLLLKRGFLDA